jgi:hypothetical protein
MPLFILLPSIDSEKSAADAPLCEQGVRDEGRRSRNRLKPAKCGQMPKAAPQLCIIAALGCLCQLFIFPSFA